MKRILLVGNIGQLGQELQSSLPPFGEVIGVNRQTMDLAQAANICQTIRDVNPDIIVNAAAYTSVDKAETETELAKAINAIAPIVLAEEAQRLGATLIHVSTDYVFDGRKNTPYTENDSPNPVSVYGQTKLAGEEGIRLTGVRHFILRTAWVYGTYGKSNFVKTMLRLFAEREEVRVVADQVGTPTWASHISDAIVRLIELQQSPKSIDTGIYNFTNSGVASWYDFAVAIFEEAKLLGFPLTVQHIVPITTPEYPTDAQRPAYSVLSSKKISAILGNHPPHWRQGLRQMLRQLYQVAY